MDLITSNTMDIMKLGMDGLLERQRAVSANIANVMTPGYVRKEVSFESQLAEIKESADLQDYIKGMNSIKYNPASINEFTREIPKYRIPTIQEKAYLMSDITAGYNPQVVDDIYNGPTTDGNNVELEKEMMDLSKTGSKYLILSNLEARTFSGLSDIIRGGQ